MAASAVAPVAMIGSSRTASEAAAVFVVSFGVGMAVAGVEGESSERWKGRLL
jgi:hypothetical protein